MNLEMHMHVPLSAADAAEQDSVSYLTLETLPKYVSSFSIHTWLCEFPGSEQVPSTGFRPLFFIKDVPGGFPKSDLLGVTVALIHVVGQQF